MMVADLLGACAPSRAATRHGLPGSWSPSGFGCSPRSFAGCRACWWIAVAGLGRAPCRSARSTAGWCRSEGRPLQPLAAHHGSGERYSCFAAQVLAEAGHEVELITHRPVALSDISEKLNLDLSRVGLRYVPDLPFRRLGEYTREYDLFINGSFMSFVRPVRPARSCSSTSRFRWTRPGSAAPSARSGSGSVASCRAGVLRGLLRTAGARPGTLPLVGRAGRGEGARGARRDSHARAPHDRLVPA